MSSKTNNTTMEHIFGISHQEPTRAQRKKMVAVAERHGAYLVEASLPGVGYQRWYCCQNLGEPFNACVERAVEEDVAGEVRQSYAKRRGALLAQREAWRRLLSP